MSSTSKVIVTFLYPRSPNLTFDMDYYLKHHIIMAKEAWTKHGMITCEVSEIEGDSEVAVLVVTTWKDMDAWKAAQQDEATASIGADTVNFTNAQATILVGKVVS